MGHSICQWNRTDSLLPVSPAVHIDIFFDRPILHLALAVCNGGRYVEEATVMMKSALLFTKAKLHFHIFTDNVEWNMFSSEVGWICPQTPYKIWVPFVILKTSLQQKKVSSVSVLASFCVSKSFLHKKCHWSTAWRYWDGEALFISKALPSSKCGRGGWVWWFGTWAPGGDQKLYGQGWPCWCDWSRPPVHGFQDLLPNQEALLYVDTDVIVIQPVEDLWKVLSSFSAEQFAALARENEEDSPDGWYKYHSRSPFYGTTGEHLVAVLWLLQFPVIFTNTLGLADKLCINWGFQSEEYVDTSKDFITFWQAWMLVSCWWIWHEWDKLVGWRRLPSCSKRITNALPGEIRISSTFSSIIIQASIFSESRHLFQKGRVFWSACDLNLCWVLFCCLVCRWCVRFALFVERALGPLRRGSLLWIRFLRGSFHHSWQQNSLPHWSTTSIQTILFCI